MKPVGGHRQVFSAASHVNCVSGWWFIIDMIIEGHAAEKIGGMVHRTGLGNFIGIENSADGPEISISIFLWSRTIQFYPKRRLACA